MVTSRGTAEPLIYSWRLSLRTIFQFVNFSLMEVKIRCNNSLVKNNSSPNLKYLLIILTTSMNEPLKNTPWIFSQLKQRMTSTLWSDQHGRPYQELSFFSLSLHKPPWAKQGTKMHNFQEQLFSFISIICIMQVLTQCKQCISCCTSQSQAALLLMFPPLTHFQSLPLFLWVSFHRSEKNKVKIKLH